MNIEYIYLELELFFNRKIYEDKIIEYKEYIDVERKILKEMKNRQHNKNNDTMRTYI